MYFQVDLSIGQGLEMLTGETIAVTNAVTDIPASISLSPGATAFEIDEINLDAIVHVVDSVLPPPFVDKNLLNQGTDRTHTSTYHDAFPYRHQGTHLPNLFPGTYQQGSPDRYTHHITHDQCDSCAYRYSYEPAYVQQPLFWDMLFFADVYVLVISTG